MKIALASTSLGSVAVSKAAKFEVAPLGRPPAPSRHVRRVNKDVGLLSGHGRRLRPDPAVVHRHDIDSAEVEMSRSRRRPSSNKGRRS